MTGVALGDSHTTSRDTDKESQCSASNDNSCRRPSGWALKTVKKSSRMTKRVKNFLESKFNEGARSGQKADPTKLAREMKDAKDEEGKLVFTAQEWRSAKQIANFFSRLTVLQRQRGLSEEDISDEDIVAMETETVIETLQKAVMNDMVLPMHPIVIGLNNVCELLSSNKLRSLKLGDLKDICEKLELVTTGSSSRKKTYYEPIEEYATSCPCQSQ